TPYRDLRFLGIESPDDIRPPQRNKHQMLRLLAGPELQLNDKIRPTLEEQEFIISRQSNRMAFRLECHTPSLTHEAEMLSVFVLPGTIQWPAGGQPILLLPNCQVTGGYPRVARVIDADLWKMAYCGPGDKLRFKW